MVCVNMCIKTTFMCTEYSKNTPCICAAVEVGFKAIEYSVIKGTSLNISVVLRGDSAIPLTAYMTTDRNAQGQCTCCMCTEVQAWCTEVQARYRHGVQKYRHGV